MSRCELSFASPCVPWRWPGERHGSPSLVYGVVCSFCLSYQFKGVSLARGVQTASPGRPHKVSAIYHGEKARWGVPSDGQTIK